MNWRSNVCNQRAHNCRKGDNCRETEECCFERDTPSGHKGNQGTCVAKGSCDFRTGLPTNSPKIPCSSENYSEGFMGMSSGNCKDWKWIVLVLVVVMIVMAIGLVYMGVKCRKSS